LLAVPLLLAGCALQRPAPEVAPAEPVVPDATWEQVDREILQASAAARATAVRFAREAVGGWIGRVRDYTDAGFIPWYTSYWTQEWLTLKAVFYDTDQPEADEIVIERLAEYLQAEYAEQVLQPAAEEGSPREILQRTTALYLQDLGDGINRIGRWHRLPSSAFQRHLERIIVLTPDDPPQAPVSLRDLAEATQAQRLAACSVLLGQIAATGRYADTGIADHSLSPAARAVAENLVRRLATRGVASAAGLAGPAGLVVSVGITAFGYTEHEQQVPELEAGLRKILGPEIARLQNDLLEDPDGGVLAAVHRLHRQIEASLRPEPVPPDELPGQRDPRQIIW